MRSSPRSVAVATGALLGKLGLRSVAFKGVLGAAGGAGIAIGTYFAFYGVKNPRGPFRLFCIDDCILAGGMVRCPIVKVPAAVCIRSVWQTCILMSSWLHAKLHLQLTSRTFHRIFANTS